MSASRCRQLLCVVGRHGSGKTTLARAVAKKNGWHHISVGFLRRLALNRQIVPGIPLSLVLSMGRLKPGEFLPCLLSKKLLEYALSFDVCVLDGFPASREHVMLLPEDAIICVLVSPKKVRKRRLLERAGATSRKWSEGRASARDDALPDMLRFAGQSHVVVFVRNADGNKSLDAAIERIRSLVLSGPD